jgi:hypothetical protein
VYTDLGLVVVINGYVKLTQIKVNGYILKDAQIYHSDYLLVRHQGIVNSTPRYNPKGSLNRKGDH